VVVLTRVNYRELRDRVTHIDATFESCVISIPGESHYSVRFYPWLEHPAFLDLADSGEWQAHWPTEAAKVVTVYPVGLIEAYVRDRAEVTELEFVDSPHPFLWEFETEENILCRDPLPPGALTELPSMIAAVLPYDADPESLSSLLNPLRWSNPRFAESGRGGFSLGRFPTSVVGAVRSVLDELAVGYLEQEPLIPSETLPVMLLIDGEDYLIAQDLEVDMPEFEHNPDWVTSPR
jgi:hypothetical protein